MKLYNIKDYSKSLTKDNINILLITHDLSATGAPIVLNSMAQLLKDYGYAVAMYSRKDGDLANDILDNNIPLIIEEKNVDEINVDDYKIFDLVVINTLVNVHHINAFLNTNINVLWWVHEAKNIYELNYFDLFPESVDVELNNKPFISLLPEQLTPNIRVFCGGDYPKTLLNSIRPKYEIGSMLYSIKDEDILYSTKFKNKKDKIKICLIGTVYERKGQDVLANAIQLLPKEFMGKCEFYFIGGVVDIQYYNVLKKFSKKYQNIHIVEPMSPEKLKDYYKAMDCLVCASKDDPMPVVVGEAMKFSKLVICSENAGSHVLIKDGYNGFVYKDNDPKQLSYKLRYLIKYFDKLYKISERSREIYEENFSNKVLLKKIQNVLFSEYLQLQQKYVENVEKSENSLGIKLYESDRLMYKRNRKNIRIVVDQLSATGQPKVALITAKMLIGMGYNIFIHAQTGGEVLTDFLDLGVTVLVDNNLLRSNGASEDHILKQDNELLGKFIRNADVSIVFGIACYSHIIISKQLNINTVWYIHDGFMGINHFYENLPKELGECIKVFVGGSYIDRVLRDKGLVYNQNVLDYGFEYIEGSIKRSNQNRTSKVKFLMPGTIHERKGQDILITAIKMLSSEYLEKCEFIFIGENNNDSINKMIEDICTEFEECIKLSSLNYDEFSELYDEVDVVVCPSRDDPAPFVLSEALAKKKVVIASTSTGTASYIKNGYNGFIHENENFVDLYHKIKFIIDNIDSLDDLRENGFLVYKENYSIEVYKDNFREILEAIIK